MIVEFEGRTWQLDPTHVRLQQAMVIQSYTGMSIGEWEDSIEVRGETGPDGQERIVNPPPEWLKSVAALYWLMLAQNDVKKPIAEVDFDFGEFIVALVVATARELERVRAQAAAAPDPTSSPSSPLGAAASPVPVSPTAMTPVPPVPQAGGPATAYTPPAALPG